MKNQFFILIIALILYFTLISCIAEVKYPSVESVSISPEEITTLEIGQSQKFTATVHGENNPPKSVTWGVSGNNSSTTIIDSNGLLTVALDETSAALVVQAKSTFDPGVSDEVSVNVVRHIISTVVVSPNNIDVAPGNTHNFTATVNGTNEPPQTVIWSLTGNNTSTTTINEEGLLTIADTETSTALVVKATSTYDTSKSGNASVKVLVPTVTSVVVSPNSVNVSQGGTQDFTATVNGSNDPPQSVTWSVSGNNSSSTTINSDGRLTVGNNEPSTSLIVQATSTYDTSKTGKADVTVLVPTVTSVVVSPNSANVSQGGTQDFTAVVNGTNDPPQTVTWSVSGNNSSSTNINSAGLLTVASIETSTSLVVKATSTYDMSKSENAIVNILFPIITDIVISPSNVGVALGEWHDFTAIVNGQNNPPQTVTWSVSGNTSSSTTINSSGRLTVANNETSTSLLIQATSTYDTNISGIAYVDVLFPMVTSIIISPNVAYVTLGGTQNFSATVFGENNPPQTVSWSVYGNNSSSTFINSSGLLSVANNETSVSLIVQATSTYDTSKFGIASVNIVPGVGDIITFGAYEWRVLDIQDDKALIVSENILEGKAYHSTGRSITWSVCSLRAYLNGEFYNSSAFSNEDRSRIFEVTNVNENNQWYGTPGGENTLDKIFLLSIAEVVQYFGDSGQLANPELAPSEWGIDDQYNSNRIATHNGEAYWWWLRSPGYDSNSASSVGSDGGILMYGPYVDYFGGVRPALWLNF